MTSSAYTPAQLSLYLSHIGLPPSYHPSAIPQPTLDLAYLTALFTHQLTAIPYDNLSLHYSPSHAISLDPQAIFAKCVAAGDRGRGGYCMENSILLHHMLRAAGFVDIYLAGVRIRPRDLDGVPHGQEYTGWVHVVNIVTLPDTGEKYAVDAGFGGDGMTFPLPLVEGLVHGNSIGTQEVRLVREYIPNQRFRGEGSHKMWVYQVRNGQDREWNAFFAFHDQFEFTEADFGVVNWYTSQAPASFQTLRPLVVRFIRGEKKGEDGRARVVGKVMLVNGLVKRNVTGRTEVVKECKTEAERVEALKEYFGITLTEEEKEAIKGWRTELVVTA